MNQVESTLRSYSGFISSHFSFNVLNQLQSEILAGDKRKALDTLNKYTRLVRQVSQMAAGGKITVNEEGKFLSNYLELESVRFEDTPFEYEISGFQEDDTMIEPFLVQPFVEQALLGGLNKEGLFLKVSFNYPEIRIDSKMIHPDAVNRMNEKIRITIERLNLFGHSVVTENKGINTLISIKLKLKPGFDSI